MSLGNNSGNRRTQEVEAGGCQGQVQSRTRLRSKFNTSLANKTGPGEMALLAKCLQHKNLRSNPQNSYKKLGAARCVQIPNAGETETGDSQGLAGHPA